MRRIVLFLSVSLLIYSCNNNGVVIKGKLENAKGSYIYLQELAVDGAGKVDSLLLPKSGSFKFKREQQYPVFYTMWVGKTRKYITLLAKPGERIKITADADSLFKTYQLKGSEESLNLQILTRRFNQTLNTCDSLNNVYQQFIASRNPNLVNIQKILSMSFDNALEEQRKFTISFIEKHPSSLANILALYQKVDSNNWVLNKPGDTKYYTKVDSALYKNYRDTPHVSALHANIQQLNEQKQELKMKALLSIMGSKAPEIAMPNVKGDTLRLLSLKGKVVLLYFWASWDEASRKENLNMISLYNKYKDKGLEIYQVSLDKTKEAWTKAIKDDKLWWNYQVCDFKYWQSPVVNRYNFDKLPLVFILDKTGVILSRGLHGEELNNKLADIFEDK